MVPIQSLPTRVYAGVTVPDTPIINEALKYARAHSNQSFYNHVVRSWLFGFIIAPKIPELKVRDEEVHALGAILHDLGFDPTGKLVTTERRCEVDGADAARNFVKSHDSAGKWDERRLQLLWDAIALHSTKGLALYKEKEVKAAMIGIHADFQGPDGVTGGLLTADEYGQVVKELPRLNIVKEMRDAWVYHCTIKPETTYDCIAGEWGDKFLPGYNREGKLTVDFIESCPLDR